MMTTHRAIITAALIAITSAPAFAAPDADTLFRDEMIDATVKMNWKGPAFDDNTRFAVSASGLSWQASHDGASLFVQGKRATIYASADQRKQAFLALTRKGDQKATFAYALSLVLAPPANDTAVWHSAYQFLARYDEGFDRALTGVMEAPEKLPLLPSYRYAAVDVMVHRANIRLLPFFMTLSGSDDRYLRSRAIVALGKIGYRATKGAENVQGFLPAVNEVSISSVQQRMITEVVAQAATDGNYRVRAAAALALGLLGNEQDVSTLDRLAKDRAYLQYNAGAKDSKRIVFPVRLQAIASLKRFGRQADDGGGTYSGKELRQALRGGQNVTEDKSNLRRDQNVGIPFCDGVW